MRLDRSAVTAFEASMWVEVVDDDLAEETAGEVAADPDDAAVDLVDMKAVRMTSSGLACMLAASAHEELGHACTGLAAVVYAAAAESTFAAAA